MGRCLGWNAAIGENVCGAGYRTGSYLCGACAPGYFDPGDGTCTVCPVSPSLWDKYRGLLGLLAGLAVFVAVVCAALFAVVRVRGGTIAGLVRRVVTLGVWALLAVQTLALVAKEAMSTSLPSILQTIYSAVSVLSLEVGRSRTRLSSVLLTRARLLYSGHRSPSCLYGHLCVCV
jgi:hypothetical protein